MCLTIRFHRPGLKPFELPNISPAHAKELERQSQNWRKLHSRKLLDVNAITYIMEWYTSIHDTLPASGCDMFSVTHPQDLRRVLEAAKDSCYDILSLVESN